MRSYRIRGSAIALAVLLGACGGTDTADEGKASAAAGESRAKLLRADASEEVAGSGRLDKRLANARGTVAVWVSLDQDSVAARQAKLASAAGLERALAKGGAAGSAAASMKAQLGAHRQSLHKQQQDTSERLASLGASELGRVSVAHNAIAVSVDAAQLASLAALPGVARVRPVLDYQMMLGETVPYVGAAAQHAVGVDGRGVRIAVLDSGVDYTHRNLGGPGTVAAYGECFAQRQAAPSGNCANLIGPNAPKVYGGFDFVGETWTGGANSPARTEDPNPIDQQGHGTNVADIAAGRSADGSHRGVAPGARILAVKVCSAVSTSCNGVAMLKGMDFAIDPNGDGDTSDAVDVINLSLGSPYGQIEDDMTQAVTNAVNLGVVVAASAGNGGNKPYIAGSPSIAPGAISVAETTVPSDSAQPLVITAPAAIAASYANTARLEWAPVDAPVVGNIVFVGRGCAADALLANPAGRIALIDRGTCNISEKVDKAARAGAIGVLVGLIAPGDAVGFVLGNGSQFVPSLVITQATSNLIKGQLQAGNLVTARIAPADAIALQGSIVASSSRGASISTQGIKPEIGAPGASVSARVGTGDGQRVFGGTSGAAPMVAGAAALMVQAHPQRSPLQIKAMLMNSAEPATTTNPALVPGERAPVTRVGAGELRADRAVKLAAAAWDRQAQSASLSFGAPDVDTVTLLRRTLTVENFSGQGKRFSVRTSFRDAADQATGAVQMNFPSQVWVPAGGRAEIPVAMIIDAAKLPDWSLNGGSLGGNGAALNGPEFDGAFTLTAGGETLTVPWHVLPRKSSRMVVLPWLRGDDLQMVNHGAATGEYDLYSLTGSSPRLPASERPGPGDNFALVDLKSVGVRYLPAAATGGAGDLLEFGIAVWDRNAHPLYPRGVEIDIDTNGDGVNDWAVYQTESGGFGASGQSTVVLLNLATGAGSIYFFNDADLNSGVMRFLVPMNASGGFARNLGVQPGTTIRFSAYAYDNYFTDNITDAIEGMRFTPGAPRFTTAVAGADTGTVASRGALARVPLRTNAAVTAEQSTESGLLLMFRANNGEESLELQPPR